MTTNGRAGLCCLSHASTQCASGTCCKRCPLRRELAVQEAVDLANLIHDIADRSRK